MHKYQQKNKKTQRITNDRKDYPVTTKKESMMAATAMTACNGDDETILLQEQTRKKKEWWKTRLTTAAVIFILLPIRSKCINCDFASAEERANHRFRSFGKSSRPGRHAGATFRKWPTHSFSGNDDAAVVAVASVHRSTWQVSSIIKSKSNVWIKH